MHDLKHYLNTLPVHFCASFSFTYTITVCIILTVRCRGAIKPIQGTRERADRWSLLTIDVPIYIYIGVSAGLNLGFVLQKVFQISAQKRRTKVSTDPGCHDLSHCYVFIANTSIWLGIQSPCSFFQASGGVFLGGSRGCGLPTPPHFSISRRSQSTLEEVKSGEPAWGSHPSFSWMGFEDNKPVAPGRMETKCAVTEPGFMAPNFTDLPHRNEDW